MAYSQSGDGRIFLLLAIIPQIIAFSLLMVVQQAGWGFKHGDGPGSYIVLVRMGIGGLVDNNGSLLMA